MVDLCEKSGCLEFLIKAGPDRTSVIVPLIMMMIIWNAIFSDVVRKNYKPRSPILKAKFSETGPETYLETCTEIKDYYIEIGKCDKMLYLLNNQAMLQVS